MDDGKEYIDDNQFTSLVSVILAEYGCRIPVDLLSPQWDIIRKVHDWRNYIPDKMKKVWDKLPFNVKLALCTVAEITASLEEWD